VTAHDGYLCCNMMGLGDWMDDINYSDEGQRMVPLGTRVRVTEVASKKLIIEVNGRKQVLANDYSRDIGMQAFSQRYVVAEDPKAKLDAVPPKLRDAILAGRVARGMTRDQVAMAIGHPVTSENPRPDAPVWRYWMSSDAEYQVFFDAQGLVQDVMADPRRKRMVFED